MAEFRALGERLVHRGHVVTFTEAEFEGPDGERFVRDVIRHPGAVSVVALDDDGDVVLVRQFRAALGGELLEIPAGKLDVVDEAPESCAHRELAEEVGLAAGHLELLVSMVQSPGFCDEINHIFLATGLRSVPHDQQGAEEAHMTIERVALAEVPALVAAGEITDAKSIVGLMLARHRLGTEGT